MLFLFSFFFLLTARAEIVSTAFVHFIGARALLRLGLLMCGKTMLLSEHRIELNHKKGGKVCGFQSTNMTGFTFGLLLSNQ